MKKGKYVYYHCTGHKGGDCKKNYIREEILDERLAELLKNIQIDDSTLTQIKEALHKSHQSEREYNDKALTALNQQYTKLKNRLDQMYTDKLDGRITHAEWLSKSEEWKDELENINIKINAHNGSNINYYEDGVRILELSRKAYSLFKSQPAEEKRKLMNIILSNCYLDGDILRPEYKKPFDLFVKGPSDIQILGLRNFCQPFP